MGGEMVMKGEKKTARGALIWDPAPEDEDRVLGPDSSAMVDYLLHPPAGYPAPGRDLPEKEISVRAGAMDRRRQALDALIDSAFSR